MSESLEPRSTYRLQLRDGLGFDAAAQLCGYLARLGVTDLYLSPILQARSGSTHGYDVVDPTRLDETLGGAAGFHRLRAAVSRHGLRLLLDLVPNHMAASAENPWWRNVLKWGRQSPYADHFDLDWSRSRDERLVLPVLDVPLREAASELELVVGRDGLVVCRGGAELAPLRPSSWRWLLGRGGERVEAGKASREGLRRLLPALEARPGDDAAEAELLALHGADRRLRSGVSRALAQLGAEDDRAALRKVLRRQHWRLEPWRTGVGRLGYRRFFDIADLVALRADREEVFEDCHRLVLELFEGGEIRGLRIDHVDGLVDPEGYLDVLASRTAAATPPPWVVVEKILAADEYLPSSWRCAGTTGYEHANAVAAALAHPEGFAALRRGYASAVGGEPDPATELRSAKRQVLETLFSSELESLVDAWARRERRGRWTKPERREALRQVLIELTACLDVYRTYLRGRRGGASHRRRTGAPRARREDLARIQQAAHEARACLRERAGSAAERRRFDAALDRVVATLLLGDGEELHESDGDGEEGGALELARRWQLLSGPAMAKGLEDTLLYRMPVLVALNTVGGEPFGIAPLGDLRALHTRNRARTARWSGGLLAGSTHDSKRSGDVRARLLALSELGEEWHAAVESWRARHASLRRRVGRRMAPAPDEELLLYQSLLGMWPYPAAVAGDELAALQGRVRDYLRKAMREAKLRSSWLSPNADWEDAVLAYAEAVVADEDHRRDLARWLDRVAPLGAWTALSQLVLRLASPGIPDTYQGSELWNLTLVDPDNRRRVDFARRERSLAELERRWPGDGSLLSELLHSWPDGRVKLFALWRGLELVRRHAALHPRSAYLPLLVTGEHAASVCAFARRAGDAWVLAVVPRWLAHRVEGSRPPIGEAVWGDTTLRLPRDAPARWSVVFGGEELVAADDALRLADLLGSFPVALVESLAAADESPDVR